MKALAHLGARARLSQLREEMNELRRAFPDLEAQIPARRARRRGRKAMPAAQTAQQSEAPPDATPRPVRKRKPMTAAQKKLVGERMRKYWAARRKAEKKG